MSAIDALDTLLEDIGLLARWRMEDSPSDEGDTCFDDTANDHDLTYKSAGDPLPDVQSTRFPAMNGGKGFTELTHDQYALLATTPAALTPVVARTYLITFRADLNNVEYVFAVGDENNNVVVYINGGNVFAQHRLGGATSKSRATTGAPIVSENEYQLAVVLPADGGTLLIYVDGVLQATSSSGSSGFSGLSIGASPTGGGNLTGRVFDVAVLSDDITAGQAAAIYAASIRSGDGSMPMFLIHNRRSRGM